VATVQLLTSFPATSSRCAESDTASKVPERNTQEAHMPEKIAKAEKDWKQQLTPNQYHVTRQKGTEPPFTGEYEGTQTAGTYNCVCCGEPLFRSETKYH